MPTNENITLAKPESQGFSLKRQWFVTAEKLIIENMKNITGTLQEEFAHFFVEMKNEVSRTIQHLAVWSGHLETVQC